MVGRRGEDLSLDRIIQLVIVGILFGVTFLLITQQDDSTGYFMDFYMHDMHLITELAIASPGDMSFTYDNIRTDLPLTYSFGNAVSVGVKKLSVNRSVGTYPGFNVTSRPLVSPFFLVWAKTPALLGVKPIKSSFETCTRIKSFSDVTVKVELFKDGVAQNVGVLRAGVARPLTGGGLPFSEDANVQFIIEEGSGKQDISISYSTDLLDGEYVGCLLKQQLSERTGYTVSSSPGNALGADVVEIRMRISRGEDLGDERLGGIIGQVIAIYRS